MTDGATIISIETFSKARRVQNELDGWRARLRLAFECNWDWRAREICEVEIERLRELAREIKHEAR